MWTGSICRWDAPISGRTFYEKVNAAHDRSSRLELEVKFRPMAGWTVFGVAGDMFEYEFDLFTNNEIDKVPGG